MLGFRQTSRPKDDRLAVSLPLDRLIDLRAEAGGARLASPRGLTHMPGAARTRQRGEGLDFDELRPYAEGDDVRHIDWNVTARSGRLHTRLFHKELERAVTIAVDFRPSMFTGSQRLKAVAAGEYAAALLWRISGNRDRAGVLAHDGLTTTIMRPAARQRGVLEGLGVIAGAFDARPTARSSVPPPCHLDALLHAINALPRSAGLTILLTDATDPGPDFDPEAGVAGQRGRLIVVRLIDLLEAYGLPAGRYNWRDGAHSGHAELGAGAASDLRNRLKARNAELDASFARHGVAAITVVTDAPAGDVWLRLVEAGVI